MSFFAIDPNGKLKIAVELGPERSEALADCVGSVAGYTMNSAPATVSVDQGMLHIEVQLRPSWKTPNAKYDDPTDNSLGRVDHFESVRTFIYDTKDNPLDRSHRDDGR